MANTPEATLRRFQSPAARHSAAMDELVRQAVFGAPDEREQARWLIWEIGQQAGVRPASIHELYLARGRGQVPPFTTPAVNIRVLSYDSARAVFRAAKRLDVGALICEIARSEIGYTEQRPAEYVAVMTAAALREGFTGPLFIQGDDVQVNAKKYAVDAETELQAVRTLIEEELQVGVYDHGVDTSALVDLPQPTLDAQPGVEQGGAPTLPPEAFGSFPKSEAIEIHRATTIQHIVFDRPKLPADLRRELQQWVKAECEDEWKKGDTEEQFYYKSRKKAIGPFKRRMWDLPADVRGAIAADLEKNFAFLFEQLRVTGTRAITDRFVKSPLQSHAQPRPVAVAAPDDLEAGE